MGETRDEQQGGQVIQFPTNRRPAPLPPLPRANPMPGYRTSSSMFGAAMTVRFDREAA